MGGQTFGSNCSSAIVALSIFRDLSDSFYLQSSCRTLEKRKKNVVAHEHNNCRVLFQTIAIYFLTNKAVYLEPGWYNPGVDLLKNILKILILRMLSVGRIFHIPNNFFLQYVK